VLTIYDTPGCGENKATRKRKKEPRVKTMEELIRKYALQNAIQHQGKANTKAVLAHLIGYKPNLKTRIREILPKIEEIVQQINSLTLDEQKNILTSMAPELLTKTPKTSKQPTLPPLPKVGTKTVMRFEPSPSGPLHIGHAHTLIINDEYTKKYNGTLILRIGDTNPNNVDPDAYQMIKEDVEWLQVTTHKTLIQSNRIPIYYQHAEQLLKGGKAYICTCKTEEWRRLKLDGTPCPHRDQDPDQQLKRWEMMINGEYDEGEATLVIKTDLSHPNPAIRDWPAFRIIKTPHPIQGEKYCVYPLMNFSVAIDDHLNGITHVIRGKDHINNTLRQEYIFNYFNWPKPVYIHTSRIKIEGTILSTTKIKQGIRQGVYTGWDDPRLGTLRALRRRGIHPEAIRKYWVQVGVKPADIILSWENLYHINREIVEPKANRYFFVQNPVPITITIANKHPLEAHAPKHPDHPERGTRNLKLSPDKDGKIKVYISHNDHKSLKPNQTLRLKNLCNIRMVTMETAEYIGNNPEIVKKGAKIIHWVPPEPQNIATTILLPNGMRCEGLAEKIPIPEKREEVVQFERFGFVNITKLNGKIFGWYTHK